MFLNNRCFFICHSRMCLSGIQKPNYFLDRSLTAFAYLRLTACRNDGAKNDFCVKALIIPPITINRPFIAQIQIFLFNNCLKLDSSGNYFNSQPISCFSPNVSSYPQEYEFHYYFECRVPAGLHSIPVLVQPFVQHRLQYSLYIPQAQQPTYTFL